MILLRRTNRRHGFSTTVLDGKTIRISQSVSSLCRLTQAQVGLGDQDSSVWKQPGPAEALKQMLFRLQAVEAELQRRQPSPGAPAANRRLHAEEHSVLTNVSVISPQDK